MFGLQKYIDNLFSIKWYFKDDYLELLEEVSLAYFEKTNDHYILKQIQYTYMDLLLGLEQMDFVIKKNGDEISITITKI